MAPFGPLQRMLMQYVARHPQVQKALREAGRRVEAHPTFQKAKQSVYSTFEKAGEKAARGASTGGAGKSTFNDWKRKVAGGWQKQMVKAVAFIAANIMTIIVLIQFGPTLWHLCKRGMRYLSGDPASQDAERAERRRRKRPEHADAEPAFRVEAPDDGMRKAILQSVPQPLDQSGRAATAPATAPPTAAQWGHSSSMFDDTAEFQRSGDVQQSFNNMHQDLFRSPSGDLQVDFNTSFLVKMGDETTFTSSLEREALTGGISRRS